MNTIAPVSVIIPCYCCSGTIERAILSIIAQTFRPAEVLLVEDASPDATLEVIKILVDAFPGWLRLVHLPQNQGAANARNTGWSMATQPYIAFLDADDAWHPQKIEIQYRYLEAHPEVALCGHGHRALVNCELPNWNIAPLQSHLVGKSALLLSNKFVTPSVMLRQEIPQRFVAQQRHMEDHMLWLDIAFSGAILIRLDVELTAIYKPIYGAGGLSGNLWSMQGGEIGNYKRLYQLGNIGVIQFLLLVAFSLAKFLRRLVVYWLYLRWL